MTRYAMAVDLDRCQGCRAWMEGCKFEINTLQGSLWMFVFRLEDGEFPATRLSFLPRPCQHCAEPACAKVCPVGARYRREDGIVLTDSERCIGCRYCMVACPYGVNYFNWKDPGDNQYLDSNDADLVKVTGGSVPPWRNPDLQVVQGPEQRLTAGGGHFQGVVEKCTFCVHRVDQGLEPACVNTCPVQALVFGDAEDPQSPVSRYIAGRERFRLLEEAGTEPGVYYLGGQPPTHEAREIERVNAEVTA